jgi:dynein heavy chain
VLNVTLSQKEIYEQRQSGEFNTQVLFEKLKIPDDGIFVHGLFIEAGKWDINKGGLCDPEIRELTTVMPVLWLKPCRELEINNRYDAPLYKTSVRAGVLSTTGHSTNFVLSILLKSEKPPSFWILRGTALVTLLTD